MNMNFDAWNDMFNAQKNMMDAWTKMFGTKECSESCENRVYMPFMDFSKLDDMYNANRIMMEGYQQWMNNFVPKGNADFLDPFMSWKKAMDNYNPLAMGKILNSTANDVYEKILKSNNFYLEMYKIWNELNKNMFTPSVENAKKNFQELIKQYDTVIMENFIPMLPEEIKTLVVTPYNYSKNVFDTFLKFYQPWADVSLELTDMLAQAVLKDPKKMTEYLKVWKKTYDATFGELATSPVVGSSREMIEQNNKVVEAMIDMITSVSQYMSSIVAVARENSRKAFEEYLEMLEGGEQPKTFNEFFKYWSGNVEKAMEKYFYTEEFSNIMALTTDAFMKFKIESDKAIEKYLSLTPIVTKADVDSLYKTVHDLKNEVKALKKQIKELEDSKCEEKNS